MPTAGVRKVRIPHEHDVPHGRRRAWTLWLTALLLHSSPLASCQPAYAATVATAASTTTGMVMLAVGVLVVVRSRSLRQQLVDLAHHLAARPGRSSPSIGLLLGPHSGPLRRWVLSPPLHSGVVPALGRWCIVLAVAQTDQSPLRRTCCMALARDALLAVLPVAVVVVLLLLLLAAAIVLLAAAIVTTVVLQVHTTTANVDCLARLSHRSMSNRHRRSA
mmetsp:Transcript_29233/g.95363  ORF Transcript_29233/g.95363 Transcript_29233/m.95363 type:complete len:219 (+) Transcript_29233:451-1107(+)